MPSIKGFNSKKDMDKLVGEVFKPAEKIIESAETEKPKKTFSKK